MRALPGFMRQAPLALAMALFAGCMSMSGTQPPRNEASVPRDARSSQRVDREAPTPDTAADEPEQTRAETVLAERRRGDYPEIATDETGFTITERVRIGGETVARYDQAMLLMRQQRYREGIRILEGIVENAPEITAPYVELGIAYGHVGELESAVEALEMAALLSPEHPIVHNELGIVYRKSGRFAEARAQYERALEVFADFHFARRNLAVLCDLYLADYDCALQNYQAYLDAAGDDPEVDIWMADLAIRSGGQQ